MIKYVYFVSYTANLKGTTITGMTDYVSRNKIKNISSLTDCANWLTDKCSFAYGSCIIHNYKFLRFKFSFSRSS